MKALTETQRDSMYAKRKRYRLDFLNLAEILNCTKEHMLAVQIGKPVPDEVHEAVIGWLEG